MPPTSKILRRLRRLRRRILRTVILLTIILVLLRAAGLRPPPRLPPPLGIIFTPFLFFALSSMKVSFENHKPKSLTKLKLFRSQTLLIIHLHWTEH